MEFKKSFIEKYEKLTDIEKFKEYSLKRLRKSFRVNTLKTDVEEIKKRFNNLEQVPWCREGFWIKDVYGLGNTLEHFLGYIYIQESASMIPPVVLDAREHENVLDLCSSPGSKTTQIAAMMKNTGMIIANDNRQIKLKILNLNLERCGVLNNTVTLRDGAMFNNKIFDRVLVDAPCSGIGTIRKSLDTLKIYNPHMSIKFANVQKKLITAGFNCLKEKGVLVYSTCTLEPEEDEMVVDYLLDKFDNARLESIELDIKRSEPVMEYGKMKFNDDIKKCLRIWPQDNDTEGFFVAKIRKK
ncbi:RsmB/NOP family class I SAM-dependent RNA methyltransferase [Candidatus Woesearchaeota archaeon]|nr:RsmB/NOP family class I SAM-dependent RNA methyltransferase [Candidatus Woesearchaeota archaeon]